MTDKMISCCGMVCTDCPSYIATKTDDRPLKVKTAKQWSGPEYEVPPEDVDCDGCWGGRNLFKHWI